MVVDTHIENSVGFFRAYISPIIAVLGVTGNVFVLLIYTKENTKTRFTYYCLFIAFFNILALASNAFMDDFLGRGLDYATAGKATIKFDTMSRAACKSMEYIPMVAYFASSYLLFIFTLDRLTITINPLRFRLESYRTTGVIVCLVCAVCSIAAGVPIAVVTDLHFNSTHGFGDEKVKCMIDRSHYTTFSYFALMFESVFTFAVPAFALIPLNLCLGYQLWRQQNRFGRNVALSDCSRLDYTLLVFNLVLSSVFFFLVFPLSVVIIIRLRASGLNYDRHYPEYYSYLKHMSRLFSSIKDINYMLSFFIYFVFVRSFRYSFFELFKCTRRQPITTRKTTTSTTSAPIVRTDLIPLAANSYA